MKSLHRPDLFSWSVFDEARDLDFNAVAWIRESGNVLVDPLPLSPHDLAHLEELGGAAWIVITNGDHLRDAVALAARFGATIAGPAPDPRHPWDIALGDGDEPVPGLRALALDGSKTPGELALLLDGTTLITGDLVRAPRGGSLAILPDAKLADRARAAGSVARLAALPGIEAILVGDGWPVFRDGATLLVELAARIARVA